MPWREVSVMEQRREFVRPIRRGRTFVSGGAVRSDRYSSHVLLENGWPGRGPAMTM